MRSRARSKVVAGSPGLAPSATTARALMPGLEALGLGLDLSRAQLVDHALGPRRGAEHRDVGSPAGHLLHPQHGLGLGVFVEGELRGDVVDRAGAAPERILGLAI